MSGEDFRSETIILLNKKMPNTTSIKKVSAQAMRYISLNLLCERSGITTAKTPIYIEMINFVNSCALPTKKILSA